MRLSWFSPAVAIALALGAATGCTHTHQVRPLGKGNSAVHASLGGPLVGVFGIVIPTPILSVGAAHGVTDQLEVLGHVDLTAAAFGSAHYVMGAAWHPVISQGGAKPTLTLAGGVHVLASKDVLVAPTFTIASAWRIARRHLIYVGVDTALPIRAQSNFIAGPLLGAEARLGKRIGVSLEAKYLAPWYDTYPNGPNWVAPGSHGFFSLLLGTNIYFGDVQ